MPNRGIKSTTEPSGPRDTFTVKLESGITLNATRSKKNGPWKVYAALGMRSGLGDTEVATFGAGTHWAVVLEAIKNWDTRDFVTPGHTWTIDMSSGRVWDATTGAIRTGYEVAF